jgi:hypothetical protein
MAKAVLPAAIICRFNIPFPENRYLNSAASLNQSVLRPEISSDCLFTGAISVRLNPLPQAIARRSYHPVADRGISHDLSSARPSPQK